MSELIKVKEAIESKIDRSKWEKWKFSDLVENIVEKVVPKNSGLEHYIGLKHLDTGSLKIRRFGETESLIGNKLKIYKGDLIFAKRNSYLKRVAIADFDAVASAHALVLRANTENVNSDFLPFFMMSELFWQRAIEISVGSLSPTINWKALAKQEFLLPPKDQQVQLAKLLWALDEVIEKDNDNLNKIVIAKNAIFDHTLYSPSETRNMYFEKKESNFDVLKLGEILSEIQYGISESLSKIGSIPILRMNNLQNGKLDLKDLKYYNSENGELDRFILKKGDVLFNRTNSFELVGKVSIFNVDGKYSFASYLIRLKSDDTKLDSRFLNFYLNTPIGLAKIRKYRTPGVSQSNINAQNLKHIQIPLPNIKAQKDLMDKIESIEIGETQLTMKISSSKSLQKSLINQVF